MKHSITICMGSSCFARGNRANLKLIEEYIRQHGVECTLTGRGCAGKCKGGPNMTIDGEEYQHVDAETLIDILTEKLR